MRVYGERSSQLFTVGIFIAYQLIFISANIVSSHVRNKRWPVECPIDGCKGQKGARGIAGPVGPQGYSGVRGPPGHCDPNFCFRFIKENLPPPIQNEPIQGEKGIQGDEGKQGRDGNGVPGDPGLPGEKGMKGTTGDIGPPGGAGEPGRKGLPGLSGPEGPPGLKGDTGDPGTPGRKGLPGLPGGQGTDGAPGRTGKPGKEGATGPPGEPGIDGRNGTVGMKGEKGSPGPRIDVIPLPASEPCRTELQGVIRFDPISGRLYFCNGSVWMCIQTSICEESGTCDSPFGHQQIGDVWYQVFVSNVTQDTQDAADVVLVVDESGSMINEQKWLLIMVPFLERVLTSAGVGNGEVRNRYCLVGFGGFGNLRRGHFRPVDGMPCIFAADFLRAQSQLVVRGAMEDGYEAIEFALDNIPFRNSPFIAKNILLVTDEGRTIIPEGINVTRQSVEEKLKSQDVLLNVIVMADYEIAAEDGDNTTVIGIDGDGISYILEPDGAFNISRSPINITMAKNNTAETYVSLALSVGGASWSLRILRESSLQENQDLQDSFTTALAQVKLKEIVTTIESCRRCTCVAGEREGSAKIECVIAPNNSLCLCMVNNGNSSQCLKTTPSV